MRFLIYSEAETMTYLCEIWNSFSESDKIYINLTSIVFYTAFHTELATTVRHMRKFLLFYSGLRLESEQPFEVVVVTLTTSVSGVKLFL
jgi:hypothetical protein